MPLSVVILSKQWENLEPCLNAIAQHDPSHNIIVVDDGLNVKPQGVDILYGDHPFVFARNANIGIRHAFQHLSDAVVLLNDDAMLETKRGFTKLYEQWRTGPPGYGLVSATTDSVGNPNQFRKGSPSIRNEATMLCFVCVLIPRSTWDTVGPLDEDYSIDYGCEDGDYSYRVRQAGLKLGISDLCFVNHTRLKSTYRAKGPVSWLKNAHLFEVKHGVRYGS